MTSAWRLLRFEFFSSCRCWRSFCAIAVAVPLSRINATASPTIFMNPLLGSLVAPRGRLVSVGCRLRVPHDGHDAQSWCPKRQPTRGRAAVEHRTASLMTRPPRVRAGGSRTRVQARRRLRPPRPGSMDFSLTAAPVTRLQCARYPSRPGSRAAPNSNVRSHSMSIALSRDHRQLRVPSSIIATAILLSIIGSATDTRAQAQNADQQKCLNALYKSAGKVGQTQGKANTKCLQVAPGARDRAARESRPGADGGRVPDQRREGRARQEDRGRHQDGDQQVHRAAELRRGQRRSDRRRRVFAEPRGPARPVRSRPSTQLVFSSSATTTRPGSNANPGR